VPQIGLLYRLSSEAELFAGYTENMRAFVSAVTSGPFSTTQAGFDAIKGTLKPETSKTVEGGLRYRQGSFQGSLAAYYVDFSNRQISISSGAAIVGSPNVLANVGSVRSYGFEAAATVRLPAGFNATVSYAYNDSTYRNDVPGVTGAGTTLPTLVGKTVVDSPKSIASAELAYQGKIVFGRVGASYMSKRYYNYLNDASVPGRTLVDASIGAKIPEGHGLLSGFAIEGSVSNLFDESYVSTVGSAGFGYTGDGQTLLPGAPRQWFVTLRRGF
jgi:iron complex outermembrane receptor protein